MGTLKRRTQFWWRRLWCRRVGQFQAHGATQPVHVHVSACRVPVPQKGLRSVVLDLDGWLCALCVPCVNGMMDHTPTRRALGDGRYSSGLVLKKGPKVTAPATAATAAAAAAATTAQPKDAPAPAAAKPVAASGDAAAANGHHANGHHVSPLCDGAGEVGGESEEGGQEEEDV